MDPLGLHPKRRLPDKRPIQPDADRPLRAGKYKDLGTVKLIQELGKPVYANKRKIRENKPSSLLFLTYRD